MRQHSGMRPQDIVILLKIIAKGNDAWFIKDLAHELFISSAEISDSLARSAQARLIEQEEKRKVFRQSLMEFLEYGVRYVFPAVPGTMANGLYTAHSHKRMQIYFESNEHFVWPGLRGKDRGLSIAPFYKQQLQAAELDPSLYWMLALVDTIRIGRTRERKFAISELKTQIL